jgi:hypothetical protein
MDTLSRVIEFAGIVTAVATTFIVMPKAQAATITLNFEGIVPNGAQVTNINNFYNGGNSSGGTSGLNLGVTFSANAQAICLSTLSQACSNASRGGQGNASSQNGGFYFFDGNDSSGNPNPQQPEYLNYAGGFNTGVSFFYAAKNNPGSLNVYDGLNGTGNLLASLSLPTTPTGNCTGYNGVNPANTTAGFCPFVAAGIGFTGTAKSIGFGGVANQVIFDDITLGSASVPEPLTIAGTLIAGTTAVRMRKRLKSTN